MGQDNRTWLVFELTFPPTTVGAKATENGSMYFGGRNHLVGVDRNIRVVIDGISVYLKPQRTAQK